MKKTINFGFAVLAVVLMALTGCKEKDAAETKNLLSSTQTVEFNGKTIPITIFYSSDTNNVTNLNRLTFEYDNKAQTIHLNIEPQFFDSPISVSDYNFDNYMDISVFLYSGSGGFVEEIFLYNPKTKKYSRHEELSGLWSVWADSETKTVKSHGKGGHAGMIYESKEFKWENEKLVLIRSAKQDYDESLEKYIHIAKTLQNGNWEQRIDTIFGIYDAEPLIDSGNGRKYRTVKIDTLTWMAENLNNTSKGGICYKDNPENCEKYGRLYTWNEALKACPSGWHLPNNDEWDALVAFVGGYDDAGKKLKARSDWNDNKGESGNGTDEFGFSAFPGGSGVLLSYEGKEGNWWTATKYGGLAWYRGMSFDESNVIRSNCYRDNAFSVRCVKD